MDAEKIKKHGVEACRRRNLHYVSSDGKKQEEKCKKKNARGGLKDETTINGER